MRYLLLALLFVGCSDSDELKSMNDWIVTAKKPIIVNSRMANGITESRQWTLVDADGKVFLSDKIYRLALPDTIK